jgi:hypothetical protein
LARETFLRRTAPGKKTAALRIWTKRGAQAQEAKASMLHITCDLCGKELSPGQDDRYVVKIEAFAAHDQGKLTEADLDDDHMEAVSELLQDMAGQADDAEAFPPASKHFRFDLCPNCHQKFVRDPLSKDASQKFDFSKN